MLTAKKDGSTKLALNAKQMNAQIWKNKYQMPNSHELIDSAAHIITKNVPRKVWFTSLYLKYAFSQLPLSSLTSSHCSFNILCGEATGTYRFKTGFYGLTDMLIEFHKPVDHHLKSKNALHDCCHGNMVNRYFIANEDDIIVGEHRYAVGESSVAEKCHIFCNNLGRGHIHVVPCQNRTVNNDNCPKEPEKRHQTTTYLPHPNMHKDEMTHEAYWNSIQFEDPCLASAQDEFRECPAFCSSADHDEGSSKSYCLLPLWHKPLTKDSQDTSKSLTLKQGHLFACKHVSEMYHFTIFVGNSSTPSIELMNNVLDFVKKRTELEFDDRISVVTCGLDNTYHVVANHINLIDFKLSMLLDKVGLGVTFENALRAIKKKTDHQIKNPSLFFSCDKMETLWCMQSKMDRSTLKPLDDLDYLGISARYPLNVGIGEIAA